MQKTSPSKNEPLGNLGIIDMQGCKELAERIDQYLLKWRAAEGRQTYRIKADCPRFADGQGKGVLKESIRGHDIYIICDVLNHSVTFNMHGMSVPMSPDNHYQDLKRIIAAIGGKARRITVIMPYLYESRQDSKKGRESLDCAIALQELVSMGVANIIVFDAHETKVQNAIPLSGFDNIQPNYQMIKALLRNIPDLAIDKKSCMIVATDEGAVARCMNYSTMLGLELGMFYKRRDHSVITDGSNPILEHTFLGGNISGKDVIIVDDILSSGKSLLEVAQQLKNRGVNRIFIFATFGQFVNGLSAFDKAHENGLFERIFTTNLVYRSPELQSRKWYVQVDISKYISLIINTLNRDTSIRTILNPAQKIAALLSPKK
ncbi:MAG: ribose-phosphate pyrophosphokinase [Defluviitaleaceae bacterium]|nr:ribose-phosphate pyrophosphokinase [Defluviitaleaceae bacterium]